MEQIKEKEKQFKGKGKPRKADKREKDPKFPKDKEVPIYKQGHNDPSWRCNDAVMTKLVASLPFLVPAGTTQTVPNAGYGITQSVTYRQPGIMSICTYLTGGNSKDYNSALNMVGRKIYSFVRHANSGSRNYEAADLTLYLMAVGQLLGLLGFLQRLLAVAHLYSPSNRYLPIKLMQVMGVNGDDVIANYAQLKYTIAWLGRVIGSLAFPDIPYFKACYEAFKYVYRDNDSPKEQIYVLNPEGFAKYSPTYSSSGGGITYATTNVWEHGFSTTRMTVANLLAFTRELTDVLLGDEDCGIMSGDILKAFPNGTGLFKPTPFGEEYDVFLHSPEVLQQIHNCQIVYADDIVVTGYGQQPGTTGNAPYVTHDISTTTRTYPSEYRLSDRLIIDAFSKEPAPEEVVNCTVLTAQFDLTGSSGSYKVDPDTLVFDLFLPVRINVYKDLNPNSTINTDIGLNFAMRYGTNIRASTYNVNYLESLTNFDWHPMAICIPGGSFEIRVVGDIQNFRIFDNDIAKRIHDNSILNLFSFKELNFFK